MSNCPVDQLDAFYDGELNAAQTAAIRDHLAECDSCQKHLAECAAMSRLFSAAPAPRLLPISNLRLHNVIDNAMESGLVRIAWMLSAVAACVLIAGSFWLMRAQQAQPAETASTTPPWATVATTADADVLQQDDATPVARWYLASAAGPQSEDLP